MCFVNNPLYDIMEYALTDFTDAHNICILLRPSNETGAYDDPNGSHISIEVTSSLFEGKRPVQRQQLVYKALWEGEIYF